MAQIANGTRYVETTDEYRRDGADFVEQNALKFYRFDLSDEEVRTAVQLNPHRVLDRLYVCW